MRSRWPLNKTIKQSATRQNWSDLISTASEVTQKCILGNWKQTTLQDHCWQRNEHKDNKRKHSGIHRLCWVSCSKRTQTWYQGKSAGCWWKLSSYFEDKSGLLCAKKNISERLFITSNSGKLQASLSSSSLQFYRGRRHGNTKKIYKINTFKQKSAFFLSKWALGLASAG